VNNENHTQLANDSFFNYTFNAPRGHFRIWELQTDTFRDFAGHKLPACAVAYPPIDTNAQYWVTIYPHTQIKLTGDTLLCVNKPGKFTTKSGYGEYKHWNWDFGNGAKYDGNNAGDSVRSFVWTQNDYNIAVAKGDTDLLGRAIFLVRDSARSDTGGVTSSGCASVAFIRVHVESSIAAFKVDSTIKITTGAATYKFINESKHAVKYTWNFGDSTKEIVTTDGKTPIMHTYETNPLMSNNVPEGLGQPLIKYTVRLTTLSADSCPYDTTETITILREYQHYNVFTPNGDGINDKFVPGIEGSTKYNIKIFNRWGQKVFESNSPTDNWDGKDQTSGTPCPDGAYYYTWNFTLITGVDKSIKGAVTLIRKQ
jgi:gliding motility-associated-like protein